MNRNPQDLRAMSAAIIIGSCGVMFLLFMVGAALKIASVVTL